MWLTPCKPEEPGMAWATRSSMDWGCEPNIWGSNAVGPPLPGPLSLRESPSPGCSKSCDSNISFVSIGSSSISWGSSLTPGSSKITWRGKNIYLYTYILKARTYIQKTRNFQNGYFIKTNRQAYSSFYSMRLVHPHCPLCLCCRTLYGTTTQWVIRYQTKQEQRATNSITVFFFPMKHRLSRNKLK